jgi:tRNA(Arg) A34 adenosine deaminase TadA
MPLSFSEINPLVPTSLSRDLRSEGRRGFQFPTSETIHKIDNFREIASRNGETPLSPLLDNPSDFRVFLAYCRHIRKFSMVELSDLHLMETALKEAKKGAIAGEVPVGAVLVMRGTVIARAHNACVTTQDPTAHAEIIVLRKAAKILENYRLSGCELFVTVEPCAMCVGAMIQARVSRLVYGAHEEKTGMVESRLPLLNSGIFNHHIETAGGVLREECGRLIQEFFIAKRKKQSHPSHCRYVQEMNLTGRSSSG